MTIVKSIPDWRQLITISCEPNDSNYAQLARRTLIEDVVLRENLRKAEKLLDYAIKKNISVIPGTSSTLTVITSVNTPFRH